MKPIHKFNNGVGATLCHQCNCIASLGYTEDLYCKECNKHRKELLIELMRLDESIGLYIEQAKNEEPKQRLEKYSERFDNKENELVEGVFNPDTWGKRIIEETKQGTLTYTEAAKKEERIFNSTMMSKQETLEELAERYYEDEVSINAFINGAKWQQEKMYSEEEALILISKYIENNLDPSTHGNIENIKEWFEQFKNK
jgi:23S rRNA pseudoU1915 N3-methylase RlmH